MPLKPPTEPQAGSVFIDSGAFSLFSLHVLKRSAKVIGAHGRELAMPENQPLDYSFYDLRKGSEFRQYLEGYAKFMKKMRGRVLLANVDVIYNPDLTWQVQQYFEEEHGLTPIPIVHYRTPLSYVDRYLEAGKYDIIGVGGFAWGGDSGTVRWLDAFFRHVCPKRNKHCPVIKVHGFALTGWFSICRWPWWSVDSTSWLQTASFGGIIVPAYSTSRGWRFDRPPRVVGVSYKAPSRSARESHFENLSEGGKQHVLRWLQRLELTIEDVAGCEDEGDDYPSYSSRFFANLTYFKDLEESRPKWPHPLDLEIVNGRSVLHQKGFGL